MNKQQFKHKVFSLSERLYPLVYRLLGNQANTEDAIQDIMMKLWLKRKELDKHPNLKGFVFLTARNYCIDLIRKKKLNITDSLAPLELVKSNYSQGYLEYNELNIIIKKVIKDLPEQQRDVIVMRDLDGYEFTEIASALNLKIEHVRVLLSRARKHVGATLQNTYSYERK